LKHALNGHPHIVAKAKGGRRDCFLSCSKGA
jgi:hypothetical protein